MVVHSGEGAVDDVLVTFAVHLAATAYHDKAVAAVRSKVHGTAKSVCASGVAYERYAGDAVIHDTNCKAVML